MGKDEIIEKLNGLVTALEPAMRTEELELVDEIATDIRNLPDGDDTVNNNVTIVEEEDDG